MLFPGTPPRLCRTAPPALSLLIAAGIAALAAPVFAADDPCAGYKWDVSKQRALFASAPISLAATGNAAAAPGMAPNRLYRLQLLPASEVSFPVTPGKMSPPAGTFAGIFKLTVPVQGSYRIAVDLPLWIDVAANGKLVPATDYEGRHDCNAPRKIVEFTLDATQPLLLQLSGAGEAAVRLAITATLRD